MPRREDFENSLWSDPEFLALSSGARLLYIWTWTNPRCGMSGLYKLAPAAAAYETGLGEQATLSALEELAEARFAFYADGVIFVRTRVKHLRQKTEQIAKAIRNDLKQISNDHPLKARFRETYSHVSWLSIAFSSDPQEGPVDPVMGGEGRPTLYGTGTGTGKGNGKGNRRARADAFQRYTPDAEAEAIQQAHFPDMPVTAIEGIVQRLRMHQQDVTPEAINAVLGDTSDYTPGAAA